MHRVLICNRGEIAVRVARAAAGLGIESVAVYPAVDADGLHTRAADHARRISEGPGPDAGIRAYLDGPAIIAAALAEGCDAVHPGYGFLAENADFAEACAAAGLTFVGPRPDTIRLFGDKVAARALAHAAGVPVVPGSMAAVDTVADALAITAQIGFPIMLKAAAGGGGRGIRRVDHADQLAEAFARCQSEARAAFGDGALFVERLIVNPRHIEVQILGDAAGAVVHLHERDCSVQLRNQKVVEIAPAPSLAAVVRERLLADALGIARAAGYVNAGTVEFLVDPELGQHWFIECNPRIQVEHTVTEEVTGIDLVEAQFRIAAGAALADLGIDTERGVPAPRGFAVQLRLVALGPGTFTAYREPAGPGIRVDAAAYLGYAPPPQFDPLFAKLIVRVGSGLPFERAVDRAARALAEFQLAGVPTNVAQLQAILAHPRFLAGDARTTWLASLAVPEPMPASPTLALLNARAADLIAVRVTGADVGGTGAHTDPARAALRVEDSQTPVRAPLAGALVEWSVAVGDRVGVGD
ncbi:MAG: biotin carboxylase N-terminal domain-containing protein, partial [Gammaproteobacteria bacterium]